MVREMAAVECYRFSDVEKTRSSTFTPKEERTLIKGNTSHIPKHKINPSGALCVWFKSKYSRGIKVFNV